MRMLNFHLEGFRGHHTLIIQGAVYSTHSHGLQTLTLHLSMSLTFRVTITKPWAAAVAAMSESITGSLSLACSASP